MHSLKDASARKESCTLVTLMLLGMMYSSARDILISLSSSRWSNRVGLQWANSLFAAAICLRFITAFLPFHRSADPACPTDFLQTLFWPACPDTALQTGCENWSATQDSRSHPRSDCMVLPLQKNSCSSPPHRHRWTGLHSRCRWSACDG